MQETIMYAHNLQMSLQPVSEPGLSYQVTSSSDDDKVMNNFRDSQYHSSILQLNCGAQLEVFSFENHHQTSAALKDESHNFELDDEKEKEENFIEDTTITEHSDKNELLLEPCQEEKTTEKVNISIKRPRSRKTDQKKFGSNSIYFYHPNKLAQDVDSDKSDDAKNNLPNDVKRQKKRSLRSYNHRRYDELINIMKTLSQFDWSESTISQKFLNCKNSFVYFIVKLSSEASLNVFANKNPRELMSQIVEKIRTYIPEVTERIVKNDIKVGPDQKCSSSEYESILHDNIRRAIKAYSETYINNDFLKKTISPREIQTSYKQDYCSNDDEWILLHRHYIDDVFAKLTAGKYFQASPNEPSTSDLNLSYKIDLQDLITSYEKDLYDEIIHNEKILADLEHKVVETVNNEPIYGLKVDADSIIVDLKLNFPEDEAFINLLEKRQNENNLLKTTSSDNVLLTGKSACNKSGTKFKPRLIIDDMVCQVCNDGDYTDEDLIVFCSRCNVSVHQRCYGIPTIPEGDWICDVCLNFKQNGKYLRCPLCEKRGGAMKYTNIKANTDMFESLNPGFHAFLKSYATDDFMKESLKIRTITNKEFMRQNKNQIIEDISSNVDELENACSDNLYYDFQFISDNFNEGELINEPKPTNIWVHMTCSLFTPELYFDDQTYLTNVLGMENISKERFKHECEVCKKKRNGSIVYCAKGNCKKSFHSECARRAQYCLDTKVNELDQVLYCIYCEKHTPLKLRRCLDGKDKKMKEEICQFFKIAEKCCAILSGSSAAHKDLRSELSDQQTKKAEKKEEDSYFMKLLQKFRETTANKPFTIDIERMYSNEGEDLYEVSGISLPKLNYTKDRKLTPEDEIWSLMPYSDFTSEQKYRKYRKILNKMKKKQRKLDLKLAIKQKNMEKAREAKIKNSKMMNPDSTKKTAKEVDESNKKITSEKKEKQSKTLYCLCQKKYTGELMIACDLCVQWFHPQCVGIPDRYDLDHINWFCKKCCHQKGYKDLEFIIEEKIGKEKLVFKKRANDYDLEEEEDEDVKESIIKKLKTQANSKNKAKK